MKNKPKIEGGYVLLARKTIESNIMDKPPLYFKLWFWILLQAKFNSNKKLKRGQFVTSIKDMREAMVHHVGYRKETPTAKRIRRAYEWLAKVTMIGLVKVPGGLLVTILNYGKYQNPKNYEGHNEGRNELTTNGFKGAHLIYSKNDKNDKNVNKTFPQKEDFAVECEVSENTFYLTKKKKKLSGERLKSFLLFWEAFNYKKDKASAADSWIDIPIITNTLVNKICAAAKREAIGRQKLLNSGKTPIYAQGWITARRWEDEETDVPKPESLVEYRKRMKNEAKV